VDPAGLIASLEDQLRDAKPVPLTDQVRLEKTQMDATLSEMRTGFSRAGLTHALPLADRLDQLFQNAKPIPLTDQVRVDKAEAFDILDQMRASVASATN
jgi:hypothetical protein